MQTFESFSAAQEAKRADQVICGCYADDKATVRRYFLADANEDPHTIRALAFEAKHQRAPSEREYEMLALIDRWADK